MEGALFSVGLPGFVRQCEGGDSLRGVLSTWVPLYSHIRTLVRGKDATRLYRTLVRYGQLVLSILLKNPATDSPTFWHKEVVAACIIHLAELMRRG